MTAAPLVTVAIPCFNSAQWVRAAVESALAQAGPTCEVVVVDDGSTDGSREILASFGKAIRVFHAAHGGAPQARNLALREARGEWLQYLDADDALEPGKIATQLAEADGGAEADVICAPFWYEVWRGGAVKERYRSGLDGRSDPATEWIRWELPQTGGALWRKTALESLGGWKEGQPCCQEHELYLRAIQAGLRFVFTPSPGAVYRLWSEETLCRKDPRMVIRIKTGLLDQLHSWLTERGEWTAEHQRLAGIACFEMSRSLARHALAEAAEYARDRKQRGLFRAEGPAARTAYRLALLLFGFVNAERIAIARRHPIAEGGFS